MKPDPLFRTTFSTPSSQIRISHETPVMTMGSCFATHIGELLFKHKFPVHGHPWGILFHPLAIQHCLSFLLGQRDFTEAHLTPMGREYLSFYHSGKYRSENKQTLLKQIQEETAASREWLNGTRVLMLTWGTAWAYQWKETGLWVANCHKVPQDRFRKALLEVEHIVSAWKEILVDLWKRFPHLEVILTVSPVRHLKDGFHENQLSKSTLLLAIHQLQEFDARLHYFPAYEWIMDDLRDYRFFKPDMIHPNEVAIQYIWEKFRQTYFSAVTLDLLDEIRPVLEAVHHRPGNRFSVGHQSFLHQQMEKVKRLRIRYPFLDFSVEEKYFAQQLTEITDKME